MKQFKEFIERGIVKEVFVNKSRARALIEESERKDISLKEILDKIGLNKGNANDIIEYCYDIILNLVRAKMLLSDLKSSGEGAHEAEVYYLGELGFSEFEVKFLDELRYYRNGIKY